MAKRNNPSNKSIKNAKSNGFMKAAIITLLLIASALVLMYLSSRIAPPPSVVDITAFNATNHEGTFAFTIRAAEFDTNMLLRIGLSIVNTLLVIYLLFVYVRDYLRLKSGFTLGIIAFLFSFLLYSVSSIPFIHILFGPRGIGDVLSFVPMVFSAIGLLIFAKLSNE